MQPLERSSLLTVVVTGVIVDSFFLGAVASRAGGFLMGLLAVPSVAAIATVIVAAWRWRDA